MSGSTTISHVLTAAIRQLERTSASAHRDAEILLCYVLNCNTAHLKAWPEKTLSTGQTQQFNQLIEMRESGSPVAYLVGKREFWSLVLNITPATLIPRPETETLIEFVLERFDQRKEVRMVDLGTGSGAIALAIASERPDWMITATDISEQALTVAKQNAEEHQIRNVNFIVSHWFDALKGQHFDIIISNPPYIAENDPHLSTGDVRFEPVAALASGDTGMDDIKTIASEASQYLNNNGWLILEHGYDQKKQAFDCLKLAGFEPIIQKHDLANRPRMTAGFHTTS